MAQKYGFSLKKEKNKRKNYQNTHKKSATNRSLLRPLVFVLYKLYTIP